MWHLTRKGAGLLTVERIIIILAWIISLVGLLVLKRLSWREKFLLFIAVQFFTWSLGMINVELGVIQYPVRDFSVATSVNFSFHYVLFPAIGVYFVAYYPAGRRLISRLLYNFSFAAGFVIGYVLCRKYTELVDFKPIYPLVLALNVWIGFNSVNHYYDWFYGKRRLRKEEVAP
ncbi:CBO0543 family protein [Paenibacillus roseus]|uniref:Uncharacterized protein n=1 Tax=Paenibacillus roseus TaxID=2798579 RepID=A0A934J3J3_9BACL|nr:CBO0543 family protein [Paenibacillus roseus]MBJ6360979.1 hypothetical protein [Paenibacillus roseus]